MTDLRSRILYLLAQDPLTPDALKRRFSLTNPNWRTERAAAIDEEVDRILGELLAEGVVRTLEPSGALKLRLRPKLERKRSPAGVIPHGTSSGYSHHKCRCPHCREWRANQYREKEQGRRRAA